MVVPKGDQVRPHGFSLIVGFSLYCTEGARGAGVRLCWTMAVQVWTKYWYDTNEFTGCQSNSLARTTVGAEHIQSCSLSLSGSTSQYDHLHPLLAYRYFTLPAYWCKSRRDASLWIALALHFFLLLSDISYRPRTPMVQFDHLCCVRMQGPATPDPALWSLVWGNVQSTSIWLQQSLQSLLGGVMYGSKWSMRLLTSL